MNSFSPDHSNCCCLDCEQETRFYFENLLTKKKMCPSCIVDQIKSKSLHCGACLKELQQASKCRICQGTFCESCRNFSDETCCNCLEALEKKPKKPKVLCSPLFRIASAFLMKESRKGAEMPANRENSEPKAIALIPKLRVSRNFQRNETILSIQGRISLFSNLAVAAAKEGIEKSYLRILPALSSKDSLVMEVPKNFSTEDPNFNCVLRLGRSLINGFSGLFLQASTSISSGDELLVKLGDDMRIGTILPCVRSSENPPIPTHNPPNDNLGDEMVIGPTPRTQILHNPPMPTLDPPTKSTVNDPLQTTQTATKDPIITTTSKIPFFSPKTPSKPSNSKQMIHHGFRPKNQPVIRKRYEDPYEDASECKKIHKSPHKTYMDFTHNFILKCKK